MDSSITPLRAPARTGTPWRERLGSPGTGTAPAIAVGVVDDHPIVRAGLLDCLSYEDDIVVAGVAADAAGAVELLRTLRLDVLMLDLGMPGRSGLDLLGTLRTQAPDVAVLVFTSYPAERYATKVLHQGARAYLQKTCDLAELPVAIRALAAGHRHLTPAVAELLALQLDPRARRADAGLTDRELQVLLKLAQGVRTEKIADHLAISVKTVSTYRSRLLAKLELGSNNELTYYALKQNLLE